MLLERADELARAAVLAGEAASGRGSLIALSGPAGIGKTRLLDAVSAEAARAGLLVLTARGGELERDFPFGLVRQLVDPLLVRIAPRERADLFIGTAGLCRAVFEQDDDAGREGSRPGTATLHGLYWLLATLAQQQPIALCVDDLQWSDSASHRFFVFLGRRLEEHPVLLVVASRDAPSLEGLVESPGVTRCVRLRVRPLSSNATAQLIGQELGQEPDPAFVAACQSQTSGNPFFLTELLPELAALRVAPVAANAERVREMAPEGVERFVEQRIARASPSVRTLMGSLAVIGENSDPGEISQLSGLTASEVEEALHDLRAMGLVARGDPPRFAHPIVSGTVTSLIPPDERDALHRQAAHRAADTGALGKAAAHLLATTPAGDPWAVGILRRGATLALARGDPDAAAAALRRASLEPPPGEERPAVLLSLGTAEAVAGDPRAIESLTAALDVADAADRANTALLLGRVLSVTGRIDEAIAAFERGKQGLGPTGADQVRRLEAERRFALQNASRPLALPDSNEIQALLNSPTAGARALLAVLALEASFTGLGTDAARYATEALGGGVLLEDEDLPIPMLPPLALAFCDQPDASAAWLTRIMTRAQIRGAVIDYTTALCWRAHANLRAGRIHSAEEDARAAWEADDLEWMGHPATAAFMIRTLVERSELQEAVDVSTKAESLLVRDTMNGLLLLHARGVLHAADGQLEQALDELLACGRGLLAARAPGSLAIPWRSDATLVLVRLSRRDEARDLAAENLTLARKADLPGALGVALRATAVVEDDAELMEQAMEMLRTSKARLELARSLIDLGIMRDRSDGPTAGRPLLHEGLDLADECGSVVQARRAREALLATGARPRRPRTTGFAALTASERRVAALAADGATNREIAEALFVTLKTVEKHLTRTYRKLGITSRSELGDALRAG